MSIDCSDAGERIDVDNQRLVRARKEHNCCACGETIARGHVYVRHVIIYAGVVDLTIRCLRCDAIYEQLCEIHREANEANRARAKALGHGGDWDSDWPDKALGCGHEFKARWGTEPPPKLARLAFATPEEMQTQVSWRKS